MVVAVLFNAGDHVPVIPFSDVVDNGANTVPEHIAATGVKIGITLLVTVMVTLVSVAH